MKAAPEPYLGKINSSPTRAHSANFYGPERVPIPRVQETSVEFHQNVRSLCVIVQSKLGFYNLTTAVCDKHAMTALRRLEDHQAKITSAVPNMEKYQLVIVEDILRYSRDMGSRNTLWVPDDFEVDDLIGFLKRECIDDPALHPILDLAEFYNPFQKFSSHAMSAVNQRKLWDGVNPKMWGRKDPVELEKLREKANPRDVGEPKLHTKFRTGLNSAKHSKGDHVKPGIGKIM